MKKGLFLKKGMPKSRFAPGSSTVVLLFEKNKVRFDEDLLFFSKLKNIPSIFTNDFENPLVEIDLNVREQIAVKL
jgi:phosphatidylserine decarboxylase